MTTVKEAALMLARDPAFIARLHENDQAVAAIEQQIGRALTTSDPFSVQEFLAHAKFALFIADALRPLLGRAITFNELDEVIDLFIALDATRGDKPS